MTVARLFAGIRGHNKGELKTAEDMKKLEFYDSSEDRKSWGRNMTSIHKRSRHE